MAVLNAVEGITSANHFGPDSYRKGTQSGVHFKVRVAPGEPPYMKRMACGPTETKIDAALRAKGYVAEVLGSAALEVAEERVRAELAAAAAAAGPPAPSAFEWMAAAQHVAPAEEAAAAAEKLAAEARAELAALEQQLEAAAKKVEEAEARATQLEEEADDAREAAGLARKRQKAQEGDAEPNYRRWTLAKFNELETKEEKRRATEIDESRTDVVLPAGDETRGWHRHWRYGVFRILRRWSGGSKGAIVAMLAKSAIEFTCVDQVRTALARCTFHLWHVLLHSPPNLLLMSLGSSRRSSTSSWGRRTCASTSCTSTRLRSASSPPCRRSRRATRSCRASSTR